MQYYDYLLIGGGLAGLVLAWKLHERGRSALVLDASAPSNASRIGAGIINPISGKRYSPVWNSAIVLPAALNLYARLEEHFGEERYSYIREVPTLRLFGTSEERLYWEQKRANDQAFARIVEQRNIPANIRSNANGGLSYTSWHVSVERVVARLHLWLESTGALVNDVFAEEELRFSEHGVHYRDIQAGTIIACTGWAAHHSSLWRNVWRKEPLSPAKGDILTVRILEDEALSELVVQDVFILPLWESNGKIVKIGASYRWDELNDIPDATAARELLLAAQNLLPVGMEVLRHVAGVRPASRDSKPIIGTHPHYKHCAMMNGLGAKGSLYAPFAAECLIALLEDGIPVPEEIALERFVR